MQIGFMLLRSLYKFLHEKWGFQSKGTRWLSRKWNSGSQHVWKVTGCHFHCPLGGVCSCSYWLLCVSWIRKAARCNLPSLTTVTFCALAVKHCFANCSPFCLFIFMVFSFWKVWSLKYIYIYILHLRIIMAGEIYILPKWLLIIWPEIKEELNCAPVLYFWDLF